MVARIVVEHRMNQRISYGFIILSIANHNQKLSYNFRRALALDTLYSGKVRSHISSTTLFLRQTGVVLFMPRISRYTASIPRPHLAYTFVV